MRAGEVIRGYRLLTDATSVGGGMSEWSKAERNGEVVFIKRFLSPKYLADSTKVSDRRRKQSILECRAFEQRHHAIQRAVDPMAEGAGNLVLTRELFRHVTQYYKVTEWVNSVGPFDTTELRPSQRLVLLRTLAMSVRLLHHAGIVHGDIKPENVLLKRVSSELLVAKLIDFDDAFCERKPPPADELVGTDQYYSPEMLLYKKHDPRARPEWLTTASDIFSLGLLIHHLLVGRLPGFDQTRFTYACQAVASGERLHVADLHGALGDMVAEMLRVGRRPSTDDVVDLLLSLDNEALSATARRRQASGTAQSARRGRSSAGSSSQRLRSSVGRRPEPRT